MPGAAYSSSSPCLQTSSMLLTAGVVACRICDSLHLIDDIVALFSKALFDGYREKLTVDLVCMLSE